MRFFAILILAVLACFSAGALVAPELVAPQLVQVHRGNCPMHGMICNIYCPPTSLLTMVPRQEDGCTKDSECATDEKCCKPSCGCTHRCAKATTTPQFPQGK
ncbi:unnamed protein product [Adineta steineri]|uniref:WAP domain-containing protein n=1 Tax=Adineta steineri TaxID=433720 RepID=A0A814SYP0_9BILA|nr:unnamed protein product [Adineta steineri]CAF0848130.1 unnamed protein product [Adineta steineri]CAF1154277.1 unnamed protein product [Adineta steineri]